MGKLLLHEKWHFKYQMLLEYNQSDFSMGWITLITVSKETFIKLSLCSPKFDLLIIQYVYFWNPLLDVYYYQKMKMQSVELELYPSFFFFLHHYVLIRYTFFACPNNAILSDTESRKCKYDFNIDTLTFHKGEMPQLHLKLEMGLVTI